LETSDIETWKRPLEWREGGKWGQNIESTCLMEPFHETIRVRERLNFSQRLNRALELFLLKLHAQWSLSKLLHSC
jgi:hypothetical protein